MTIKMMQQLYYTNKQKKGYHLSTLLFLFFATGQLTAQPGFKPGNIPFIEKVFVVTDKTFYVAGEIIWMKIYARNDRNGLADSISKIAYIELLNPDNKPVLQAKIQLNDGSGTGSLTLPTSLNSGNYLLRAYTAWMENFSADHFFYADVSIVNPFKAAQFSGEAAPGSSKYEVNFFPESGNLVGGLENKLAVKVAGIDGSGVNATGTILDDNNNSITSFSTLKFGIGSFSFTPAPGKHYHAVITINNTSVSTPLPDQQTGYLLHLDDKDDTKLFISVWSNPISLPDTAWLLIQTRLATASHLLVLQNGRASMVIDKALLAPGISKFTLLNAAHQPVCTRMYFKKPAADFIRASADRQSYAKRDKVTIEINGVDDAQSNLSLSVCRIDSLQTENENSINTAQWLGNGIKIESPEYYLSADKDVPAATDNLMMMIADPDLGTTDTMSASHLPEVEGHIITGKILNKKTGEPASNVAAYLSVPGQSFRMAVAISNEQGIVRFNVPGFAGTDEVVVQTDQTVDSNYRVDILSPFSDKFAARKTYPLLISDRLQRQLLQHSISSQVQNAYYNDQQNQFLTNADDSIAFFGDPDKRYNLDDYTRFTTMEEVLREYVPEVAPRKHQEGFHLRVEDKGGALFDQNPLVMVDGVPFFNMDTVMSFDPRKIKSLSVLDRKYYYGPLTFYGILSYATYKGDLDGIDLDPASLVMEYDGMQLERKFFAPAYETEAEQKSRLPDFRNTLCWIPDLMLDTHEQKKISFYTSDIAGNYLVVLQGFTSNGKAVVKKIAFKVN